MSRRLATRPIMAPMITRVALFFAELRHRRVECLLGAGVVAMGLLVYPAIFLIWRGWRLPYGDPTTETMESYGGILR